MMLIVLKKLMIKIYLWILDYIQGMWDARDTANRIETQIMTDITNKYNTDKQKLLNE